MFNEELLEAIGAWQNGWGEDQLRRAQLAAELKWHAAALSSHFRTVNRPCFRKRFLHSVELGDLLLKNERHEGIASWTTDRAYAERFKGLVREGAVCGAIFCHTPALGDCLLNIAALWQTSEFGEAVDVYSSNGGTYSAALLNFRDLQGEVVLDTPLRASEIVALTGAASPFDILCDRLSVPEDERNRLFREIHTEFEPRYLTEEQTQRALQNTIAAFRRRYGSLI